MDYVDLFLIHWPMVLSYGGDFVSTWQVLEEFKADGRARSIGVSNFRIADLERLLAETDVIPAVNQIEINPYFSNDPLRAFGHEHGIVAEAWSPLAQGAVLGEPGLLEVASRLGRSPAQVVMRWHLQRGDILFPKDDFAALGVIDAGEAGRTGANPDKFDYRPR